MRRRKFTPGHRAYFGSILNFNALAFYYFCKIQCLHVFTLSSLLHVVEMNCSCLVFLCLQSRYVLGSSLTESSVLSTDTAWKVSVFWVFLVRIFLYSKWIRIRKTPNTDNFDAMWVPYIKQLFLQIYHLRK